jgi:hypothetical protein
MSKDINIEFETVPKSIVVDGVNYPRTQWNLNIVAKYIQTKDEAVLDNLNTVVLDI